MAASKVHAGPPKTESQLLGGPPSEAGSRQMYHALRVVAGGARLQEPGVSSEVVRDVVEDDPQPETMGLGDETVEIFQRPEHGVDAT